jgi:hypothetical protein
MIVSGRVCNWPISTSLRIPLAGLKSSSLQSAISENYLRLTSKKRRKGVPMLRMVSGSVKAASQSLAFQCDDGAEVIACSIMERALDDLIRFHDIDVETEEGMDELLGQVERIVHDKIKAGRLEPTGDVVIRTIDVLRFGSNPVGQGEDKGANQTR